MKVNKRMRSLHRPASSSSHGTLPRSRRVSLISTISRNTKTMLCKITSSLVTTKKLCVITSPVLCHPIKSLIFYRSLRWRTMSSLLIRRLCADLLVPHSLLLLRISEVGRVSSTPPFNLYVPSRSYSLNVESATYEYFLRFSISNILLLPSLLWCPLVVYLPGLCTGYLQPLLYF